MSAPWRKCIFGDGAFRFNDEVPFSSAAIREIAALDKALKEFKEENPGGRPLHSDLWGSRLGRSTMKRRALDGRESILHFAGTQGLSIGQDFSLPALAADRPRDHPSASGGSPCIPPLLWNDLMSRVFPDF